MQSTSPTTHFSVLKSTCFRLPVCLQMLLMVIFISSFAAANAATYSVDFEDAAKASYASGTVSLAGIDWDMTDALIGNLANDFFNGTRSARLRGYTASAMTMLADKPSGLGTLSFQYRAYGTDPQVEWIVEYSTDGGSFWAFAGTFTATSTVQPFSVDINESGPGRIRIRTDATSSSNQRANIDDITITDFGPASTVPTISSISPDAGVVGDAVTISGTNLSSPISVTFTTSTGTASASVSSSSATEILCTVPAGAVTGPVTVTTAEGMAATTWRLLGPISFPYGPETFETSEGGWFTYSAASTKDWTRLSTSSPANSFWEINSFGGNESTDDWLILGPFDFPSGVNLIAQFDLQRAFAGIENEVELKISANYSGSGNPNAANWLVVPFTRPATVDQSSTEFTSTGAVTLPPEAGGLSGVYLAFHSVAVTTSGSSRWRIDNFELFSSTLPVISVTSSAGTVDEGGSATGTVTIPASLGEDLDVTITSADATELLLEGNTPGFSSSTTVTIPAGFVSVDFNFQAPLDSITDGTQSVQITAEATGYEFGQTLINVNDVDYDAPSVVINKVINNNTTDVVELLVVGDGTPGSLVDLQGMILKDYSGSGDNDSGGNFTFETSSTWAAVPAGTLIVLTDQASGVEDLDATDFVLRANLGNTALFAETGGFNVGNADVVQIKAAGSDTVGHAGAIHTIGFDLFPPNQLLAAPFPKLTGASSGGFQVVTNENGILADFSGNGVTLLTSPPATGIPHNAGNANFISSLRGVESISLTVATASVIVREDAGEQTDAVTISLTSPASSNLTINLVAAPGSAITIPASVQINQDESSATFSFTPVDDGVVAGNRVVTITATAAGYADAEAEITLLDAQFTVPNVVINELQNGGNGNPDSLELLTIEPNLNMVGMILKDFSTNMTGDAGGRFVFEDVALWQSVPAGTLIVLTTDDTVTEDIDTSDGVITIQLTNLTYFTASGSFDIAGSDMVMIKAADSGLNGLAEAIHTFGVGTEGVLFTLATGPKLLGVGSEAAAANTTSSLADFNGTGVVTQSATLGLGNNIENDAFIASLRGIGEPVISGDLVITGIVGSPITPYQIIASGSPTSYGSGALPDGLVLNEETGIISGIPTGVSTGVIVQISATNGGGTGTADLAINIEQDTATFAFWSGGLPPTPELVEAYAIGGASGPLEAGEAPVVEVEGANLTLTAIVRTDDPSLTIVGVATSDLTVAFSTTDVTSTTDGVSQDGVPTGTERRKYSVPIGIGGKEFIRLISTLAE